SERTEFAADWRRASGDERDDGASGLRRTGRGSGTAGERASPAGASHRRSAGVRPAPEAPPDAATPGARRVAEGSRAGRRSPVDRETPGGHGWTLRPRSPRRRTRRRPAAASLDRTTARPSARAGSDAFA